MTNSKIALNMAIETIQEDYDIPSDLLVGAVKDCHDDLQHMYEETKKVVYDEIHGSLPDDSMCLWNKELCGYLIKQCKNGYNKYCNVHKYNHHACEHQFVQKDKDHLQTESCQNHRMAIWQKRLKELAKAVEKCLMSSLLKSSQAQKFSKNHIHDVNKAIQQRKDCFKSLYLLNDQILVYSPVGKPIHIPEENDAKCSS